MEIFTKKSIVQKIIIAFLIALLLNFTFPTFSQAGFGGMLFEPVVDLVTSVGDTILAILQGCLYIGDLETCMTDLLMGDTYFAGALNKGKYPEMEYDENGNTPVEIEYDRLKSEITVVDIALTAINPALTIIKEVAEQTGIKPLFSIPTIRYSVDAIFSGKIPAFDINFINPKEWDSETMNDKSITQALQQTISTWYNALRSFAIVGLLSVLVYVGIRIVISSTAADKSKYKQMLMDWVVALCLLFFLHYIMLFTVTIVDEINSAIGDNVTSIPVKITGYGTTFHEVGAAFGFDSAEIDELKFNTNLMGLVRLQAQYDDITSQLIYMILYIALLVYTVKYTWIYMKRTITMAFLTLIAPLVALTYPIDKLNDGKAQAFNAWLKEYIFTALLQPFHLIIYTVLLGSAMSIATKNPVYAIMVIAFMGPAEKMLRKFFGFDKASTPGTLSQAGAMFGGAAAFNMLKKSVGAIAGKRASGGGKGDGNIRTNNKPVEDRNAPDGYDAFANRSGRGLEAGDNENVEGQEPETPNMFGGDASDDEYLDWQMARQDSTQSQRATPGTSQTQRTDEQRQQENQRRQAEERTEPEILQPQPENPEQQANRGNILQRGWKLYRTPGRVGARYLKDAMQNKFGDKERRNRTLKSAAKKTLKLGGKLAVAGTVGAIGIGMGIAGDDLEDVLKYGAGGAVLGSTLGPALGRRIASSGMGQAISEEVGIQRHGNVNDAQISAQTDALYQSGELRNWSADTFMDDDGNRPEGAELNELEDRAIGHYNAGFTDTSELKKVMKLENKLRSGLNANLPEDERNDKSKAMAETIGKLARDIKPGKLSDKGYRDGKIEEFKEGLLKANPSLSKDEAKANAEQVMALIRQYYKKP